MSDIVEMLRTPTGCMPPNKWELAAADEIERLRKEISSLKQNQDIVPTGSYLGRRRDDQQRPAMTETQKQLDRAMTEVTALSHIAKAEGDLPTYYKANQAWNALFAAREDRSKRATALSNGDR